MARPKSDGISVTSGSVDDNGFDLDAIAIDPGSVDGNSDGGSSGGNSGSAIRDDAGNEFDPAIHVDPDKRNRDGSFSRKRGKRGGTGPRTSSKKTSRAPSVNAIENALVGIHAMAAMATGYKELNLDKDESRPLAEAVAGVARHYDIPGLDEKVIDWMGLIFVAGKIYGPKAYLINEELKAKSKEKKNTKKQSGTVTPFQPLNAG